MTPVYKFSTARSIVGPNTYYSSVLAGNSVFAPPVESSYHLLATEELTAAADITFSNVDTFASGYEHLQVRAVYKSNSGSERSAFYLQFNGDSGTNYSRHLLQTGEGTTSVFSVGNGSIDYIDLPQAAAAGNSNVYSAMILNILDPFNINKNTTINAIGGFTTSVSAYYDKVMHASGAWYSTDPISSMRFFIPGSTVFVAGTRFSIYGLKVD